MELKDVVAAIIALISLIVVSYIAISGDNTAIGAIISILNGAGMWFLRGRVEKPNP